MHVGTRGAPIARRSTRSGRERGEAGLGSGDDVGLGQAHLGEAAETAALGATDLVVCGFEPQERVGALGAASVDDLASDDPAEGGVAGDECGDGKCDGDDEEGEHEDEFEVLAGTNADARAGLGEQGDEEDGPGEGDDGNGDDGDGKEGEDGSAVSVTRSGDKSLALLVGEVVEFGKCAVDTGQRDAHDEKRFAVRRLVDPLAMKEWCQITEAMIQRRRARTNAGPKTTRSRMIFLTC